MAAKTRLAPVLDDDERMDLAGRLLERVLDVARRACPDVVVITPDAALEPVVVANGARYVLQRSMGLNEGLEQARAAAIRHGVEAIAILHGDLPNLHVDDVNSLLSSLPKPVGVAIAPDRAGSGTNGLALRPPAAIDFRFGLGSFLAHRAAASDAGVATVVVRRPGLAFDLDTPEDLARWLRLGDAA